MNDDCPSLADVCDTVTRTCATACTSAGGCTDDDSAFCAPRGVCVGCLADTDCPDSERCDPTSNRCLECVANADCPDGKLCNAGECHDAEA